jgi:coenzyme F420-reducing hydrogenase delta subunit
VLIVDGAANSTPDELIVFYGASRTLVAPAPFASSTSSVATTANEVSIQSPMKGTLNAFKKGADGVLILGCRGGDCHYQDGNYEAKKRVHLLHKILEAYGIEKERLKIELSVDPEGSKIPELVKEMSERLKKLGPMKKVGERVGAASAV